MRRYATMAIGGILALAPMAAIGAQDAPNRVVAPALFQDLHYRNVGPSRGGRVTAVAGHRARPSTFYFGSTGGGVWKTTDYGRTWHPVSDGFFATGSIGAIRVADANPDIVYVGTGSDGMRSNVITGRGVYRSDDAGKTWRPLGLERVGQIGAVLIHPADPDIAYVAAIGDAFGPSPDRGVYRTRDGGRTWEQVLFVSDSTGAVDLEFAPDDPRLVYATTWRGERKPWTIISGAREGGVYRSRDGGNTWTRLEGGLPNGLRGKADLAVSAADPNRVYVLMEAPVGEGGVYRSDDRGDSWTLVSTARYLLDRPFYYTNIDADPTNPDVLYVNSTGYFKSTDGGRTWTRKRVPHGDNHDMWINPDDPDLFIQSNDGGANVTRDGGETWSTQFNQPTAELYQVNVDDRFPYWLYAGQQDNSTIMVPSLPPYNHPAGPTGHWRAIGGCETGPAVPKPGDPDIVYSNCKGRFGRYSMRTGQEQQYYVGAANMYGRNPRDLTYRFQRVSPIYVSRHNPDVIYHTSQFVHRSTDEGKTWETISPDLTAFPPEAQVASGTPITRDITGEEVYSTLYSIAESPLVEGLIWVGSNDGPIHVTRDGGKTWEDVTPAGLPPGGRVQTVEPSPHDPARAYAAVLRYQLDDWQPYLYRTDDYGTHWTRLTDGKNGVPADTPTRVVREDPERPGLLYAGTEFGMYVSFDDGAHWQPFQLNLPVTPVTDIKVYRGDLILSTMGRAFWILDDLSPLRQLDPEVAASGRHLFHPRPAYRMRYGGFGFGRRGPADPEYPPPGAFIDYLLTDADGDVSLEILDGDGTLIRRFSSAAPGTRQVPPAAPGMRAPVLVEIGTPRLPTGAGMHRFRWDLRYPGAWSANARSAGRNGPLVTPGHYRVTLTAGDWTASASLEVKMDPRVVDDGVTPAMLVQQRDLSLEVRDALSQARMAVARIGEARQRLGRDARAGEIRTQLREIEAALVTAEGRYMPPMLVDQLSYLYRMLDRADQAPGRDAYVRFDELEELLHTYITRLERVLRSTAD